MDLHLDSSPKVPHGSDLGSPLNSSVRAEASAGPSTEIYNVTHSPSKINPGSPVSIHTRPAKHFPTNRHLAQADPDYSRSSATAAGSGNTGPNANNELANTELFRPTLRKKPRQGNAAPGTTANNSSSYAQSPKPKEQRKSNGSSSSPVAALIEQGKKNVSILRKGRTNQETPAPQKRSYNEGYRERMKNVESSFLFFRVPMEGDNTILLLQKIYSNITALETTLSAKLEKLNTSTATSPFDEDVWNAFVWQQIQLVESYSDFLFYASSPSEKLAITKGLVRKYKIPTRLWNNGISSLVNTLRSRSPASNNVLARFIIHCMNLLMLFVDPIYDTRHIWIESLGDLALVCLMVNVKACADWHDMCIYWYQRRALLTPGTGRLYCRLAIITESKVDALCYFCKGLTSSQPMPMSSGDILSMLNPNRPNLSGVSRLDVSPDSSAFKLISNFIHIHVHWMGLFPNNSNIQIDSGITKEIQSGDSPLVNHGASIAFCNITALLKYGDESSSLYNYFKQSAKIRRPSSGDSNQSSEEWTVQFPSEQEISQLEDTKQVTFMILESFCKVSDFSAGLQHVIVWLYFLIAVSQAPSQIRGAYIDKSFPFEELAQFVNNIQRIDNSFEYDTPDFQPLVYSTPRLGPCRLTHVPEERLQDLMKVHHDVFHDSGNEPSDADHPQLEHIPYLHERPLPEEVHIRGFAWAHMLSQYPHLNREVTPLDEPYIAYYGPTYLTPIRIKRILSLARDLKQSGSWVDFNIDITTPADPGFRQDN